MNKWRRKNLAFLRSKASVVVVIGILTVVAPSCTGEDGESQPPISLFYGGELIPGWHTGDVHVHAAGDADLTKHLGCRSSARGGFLNEKECAGDLVEMTLRRAEANEVEWLIFVEHGPWLGGASPFDHPQILGLLERVERPDRPLLSRLIYDRERAGDQWNFIKDAADESSSATGVRALMGQELGTAIFRQNGHFSAFYLDHFVEHSARGVPDTEYVQLVEAAGGWGAINHPFEPGNKWVCWFETSARDCRTGVVDYGDSWLDDRPAVFRALELSNGGRFPRDETLEMWDRLLMSGLKVSAVGGSDAHTLGGRSVVHPLGIPGIQKVGRSRTFAYVPDLEEPSDSYDSLDEDDPIRVALSSGRTVASNGPLATVAVGAEGALPGDTATFEETGVQEIAVVIEWRKRFHEGGAKRPTDVNIILGPIEPGCSSQCDLRVENFVPSPEEVEAERMEQRVVVPAGWDFAYLRVEVSGPTQFGSAGAFTSPVYLRRTSSTLTPTG